MAKMQCEQRYKNLFQKIPKSQKLLWILGLKLGEKIANIKICKSFG